MLTPSLSFSRPLGLPVCLARFPSARLWLKDESLEDSANLPLHCHPEFPASLDTLKVSVPPAVKLAAASANLDDFVNCYFGGKHGSQRRGYRGNRHPFDYVQGRLNRKESGRSDAVFSVQPRLI